MTTRGRWILVALAALLIVPGIGEAQQDRPRPDRARMEEQIRERFEALVVRELELDEETAKALAETLRSFHQDRIDVGMRRRQLQRRVEGAESFLPEAEAREVLEGLAEVARDEAALMVREQEALLQVLTPAQVVRLYGVREEFGARLRQLRNRRGGPGGAAHPGLDPFPFWP
ncbi:MAG TPA: hypothetical protein VK858_08185 [Longimicrobiales bacterium]|nr:hypothetical protein [Longimicrobiales bacterium]